MERINDDVVNAAWNLFGLTGGVEEYLLYRDIKNKSESKYRDDPVKATTNEKMVSEGKIPLEGKYYQKG